MQRYACVCVMSAALLAGYAAGAQTPPPAPAQDCSRLKGKAKKDCTAAAPAPSDAKSAAPAAGGEDKFAFPEDASKNGGELQRGSGQVGSGAGDMPTAGVPDPPSESLKPLHPGDAGTPEGAAPSSSSSSSSSSPDGMAEDDDAAPTTAGGDTPIKSSDLKDLGRAKVDPADARAKLEATRVEDDLKVGRFYLKDGNYAGATARYKDALQRDPENPDAHFGLAQVLLKQNKRTEAAAELQTYLKLAPDDDHTADARKMLAKLH